MSNHKDNMFIDDTKKVVCIWRWDGDREVIDTYTSKGYKVFIPTSGSMPLENALRGIISSRLL